MRQTGQQAFAFSNEVKWNLLDSQPLIKKTLPGITEDPFKTFGLQPSQPQKHSGDLNKILINVFEERNSIINKKITREKEEETLLK
jgi:hypothetical protein